MLLKPVLAPRQSVGRVAGHLKQELAVAPLIEELPGGWFLDWQPAEHERRGSESEILVRLLALQADAGNGPGSPELLLGNDQVTREIAENGPG